MALLELCYTPIRRQGVPDARYAAAAPFERRLQHLPRVLLLAGESDLQDAAHEHAHHLAHVPPPPQPEIVDRGAGGADGPQRRHAERLFELVARQHELEEPAHAVNKIADALPGLGIVAAVLGIVITMNFLTEGPEKIGLSVAAALVGTFLGIFMGYGFVGPASIAMEHAAKYELKAYECVKSAIVATVSGQAPQMAIEFGRKALPTDKRPGFQELNDHVRSK